MDIKAAAYMRLSREDKKEGTSLSIENQKIIIENYAKERGFVIQSFYSDDGYSGTDFERPAFKEMLNDIYGGKINCIIVKDLSRFGRNYAESGMYLERLFPYLKVRFIAVSDDYDSEKDCNVSDEMLLIFKNLINDIYAADISAKTKSSLYAKMKKGDFIGAYAVYGYKKYSHTLIIDPYAASVVRFIFLLKLKGYNNKAIANMLNENNILTPADYKMVCGENYRCGFKMYLKSEWTAVTVMRILKNDIYTGRLVQGKTCAVSFRSKKRMKIQGTEGEKRHQPIITEDIFKDVQNILKRDTRTSPENKKLYTFSGIIFCGKCGNAHIRRKNGKYVYYMCGANKNNCRICVSNRISEKRIIENIEEMFGKIPITRENIVHLIDAIYVYDKNNIKIIPHNR